MRIHSCRLQATGFAVAVADAVADADASLRKREAGSFPDKFVVMFAVPSFADSNRKDMDSWLCRQCLHHGHWRLLSHNLQFSHSRQC